MHLSNSFIPYGIFYQIKYETKLNRSEQNIFYEFHFRQYRPTGTYNSLAYFSSSTSSSSICPYGSEEMESRLVRMTRLSLLELSTSWS